MFSVYRLSPFTFPLLAILSPFPQARSLATEIGKERKKDNGRTLSFLGATLLIVTEQKDWRDGGSLKNSSRKDYVILIFEHYNKI